MNQPEVRVAVGAAREAGFQLLKSLNRLDQLSIKEKERNDFVSDADAKADQAITHEIQKHYPNHTILSEESTVEGDPNNVWIIDPLDGTRNFIQGVPHFCISIALQEHGVIKHGVIYDPIREELFTASRGKGAYLNSHRIRINGRRSLENALLITDFPTRCHHWLDQYLAMYADLVKSPADIRTSGSSALDLAYVAAGRYDACWTAGLKLWDMAAGTLLVREAGGSCIDFTGGEAYLENGHIIAADFRMAALIMKHIKPNLPDELKA